MNPLDIAALAGVNHFLHCNNADRLMTLAAGRDCLEVGAFMGGSAFFMAITAKSVTSVDTFKAWTNGQTQGEEITTLDAYLKATARFRNVIWPVVMTSEEAARTIAGDWDFIFIDADHSYETVKRDIELWRPRVRRGGILAFHDYSDEPECAYPGVKQAVDEAFGLPAEGTVEMGLRWISKN